MMHACLESSLVPVCVGLEASKPSVGWQILGFIRGLLSPEIEKSVLESCRIHWLKLGRKNWGPRANTLPFLTVACQNVCVGGGEREPRIIVAYVRTSFSFEKSPNALESSPSMTV